MLYKLKNNNYKNFDVYKINVMKPRSYFIPFKSPEKLFKSDTKCERYSSDMVEVLSGDWDFIYYSKESDLPEHFDSEKISFDKIKVPSCWQFTGYEKPYYVNTRYQFKPNPPYIPEDCSLGVYRKIFKAGKDKTYTLSFLGVAGALDVFINGKFVGYSEGSHNTSEFEINEFLQEGKNELVAVVHKFSNGTYLECQDMFRNNGIFRDVLLYKTGKNSVYDFQLLSDYKDNGIYSLSVIPSLKLCDECTLTVQLFDDERLVAARSANVSSNGVSSLRFEGISVNEWSAEIPYLYDVVITLTKEDEVIEIIKKSFGFKHIEIKGNVFYFNSKNIKFFGVNHHDTNPKTGYVMTPEDMETDIVLCKQFNVNCIRTSHYPPDPIFLELCDEYGIYVVDEADIETHGCQNELHRPGACSHNTAWKNRYWDRVYRMYERDKNHPSITMWSLGNEAWGYKNQDYCYNELKKLTNIPVHYENVVHTRRFAYDVISQMYPWQGKMEKLANGKGLSSKWYKKPYFLCEYAHAMGVGAGELETYVNCFIRADNIMGGCIWEFADHAVFHEEGKYRYTYGGDHGEKKHDRNFCVDGLFFPDRTPHSGAYQMKNCYRPVRITSTINGFEFTNLNYFKTENLTVKWESFDFFKKQESGEFELSLNPRQSKSFHFEINEKNTHYNFRYYINDFEVACESVESSTVIIPEYQNYNVPCDIKANKNCLVYQENGINADIGFTMFRAPLDNDMYLNKVWEKLHINEEKLLLVKKENCMAEYNIITDGNKKLAKITAKYTKRDEGVLLNIKCSSSKVIPFLPRFGIIVKLPKEYENVKYFGRGDMVNLPDFNEHALLGEYSCKVDDLREKYIKPQESSMRCGVRYAEITNKSGNGLRFEMADKEFIFSADSFTSQDCAKAQHQEDLKLSNFTYLHFDAYQLGAGSAACGPPPTKSFRKNSAKGIELSIMVKSI